MQKPQHRVLAAIGTEVDHLIVAEYNAAHPVAAAHSAPSRQSSDFRGRDGFHSAPASEAAPDIQAPITAPLAAEETAAGVPAVDEPRGTEIGQLAPDFTLPTLTEVDESINLRNLLYAPSVLIFWTTWCPYCLRQTPVLVDAYGRWSERGIQFVGINVQEERSAVEPYVAEHGIAYPTLLDVAGDTARAYAIQGYPTTYFLDADNRIVARHVGALTEEQLTEYLQNLQPPAEGS